MLRSPADSTSFPSAALWFLPPRKRSGFCDFCDPTFEQGFRGGATFFIFYFLLFSKMPA
jgi:hypothetical protein